MALRDLTLFAVFSAVIAMAFVRPYVGLAAWTVFTYGAPHRLTWGAAQDFSFVMLAAVVTILATVVHSAGRLPPLRAPVIFLILLMLWVTLTTALAVDRQIAVPDYIQALKIVALGVMTMLLVHNRQVFLVIVTCFTASIIFYGAKGGLFVLTSGGSHLVYGPPKSFMYANNGLGVALLMALPLAWYLSTVFENVWVRRAWLACIPLTALSILSTYSRGAALALGCTSIYWLFSSGRKGLAVVLVALLPVAAFVVMPDKFIERIESIANYENDPSAQNRLEMWGYGINVALNRPLGGGFGIFLQRHLYETYGADVKGTVTAHSSYFEVLGQHGVVGLFLFLGMGISLYRLAKSLQKTYSSPEARNFGRAVQVSLVGYAVGGAFVNKAFEWPLTFQLLGLTVAAAAIYAQEQHNVEAGDASDKSAVRSRKARPGVGRPAPARRVSLGGRQR